MEAYTISLDVRKTVPEDLRAFFVQRKNRRDDKFGIIQGKEETVKEIKDKLITVAKKEDIAPR